MAEHEEKRCYYEVLGVDPDASDSDLKKAYRALALRWHPDKNLDNADVAGRHFIAIQEAFEVLSDPQERGFYNRNRQNILRGKNSGYRDKCLDVFQYFTTSCYNGFGEDEQNFYNVYREVFKQLAAEESEFVSKNDPTPPEFGDAASSYDDVNTFYGYWQAFCTKKTYTWLDTHDIQDAENRRILRLMTQENKKIHDKAKKERNEEVRALVAFVRKRDKRVQAQAEIMKQKAEENKKKAEEHRRRALEKNRKDLESLKEAEWSKFSNMEEELKRIESSMASEFDDHDEPEAYYYDELYCIACSKAFKTEAAFENHEKSKKHRDNVSQLKMEIHGDDTVYYSITSSSSDDEAEEAEESKVEAEEAEESKEESEDDSLSCSACHENFTDTKTFVEHLNVPEHDDMVDKMMEKEDFDSTQYKDLLGEKAPAKPPAPAKSSDKKLKRKNKKKKNVQPMSPVESENDEEIDLHEVAGSKKQRRKAEREKILNNTEKKLSPRMVRKIKQYIAASKPPPPEPKYMRDLIDFTGIEHRCEYCNSSFVSDNRLQKHLNTTGHTSPLIPPPPPKETSSKNSKNSKSRKQSNRR